MVDYEELILARQEANDDLYDDSEEITESKPLFVKDAEGKWILNPEIYPR